MQETQEFGVVLHNQRMLTALLMLGADSTQATAGHYISLNPLTTILILKETDNILLNKCFNDILSMKLVSLLKN